MNVKQIQKGMTLIELVIVVLLLGVITGVSMPGMKQLMTAQQIRTTVHELSSDFALARMQAISRRRPVVVCPALDGYCINDSDWGRGWMVFVDADGDNQPDGDADIIAVRQGRGDRLLIGSNRGRPRVRYLPSGASHGSNLTVSVCAEGRVEAQVVVNNGGRTRVERHSRGNPCPI